MTNTLFIMRGVPGSGKSTTCHAIAHYYKDMYGSFQVKILSTDDFFIKDGVYTFDRTKLGYAHQRNIIFTEEAMRQGIRYLFIDNTNLTNKEMAPYVALAKQYKYEVQYITVGRFDNEYVKKYHARNQHGVPLENIQAMSRRFQL